MATSNRSVFFSHSTHDIRDSSLAHKLAVGLQQQGVKVWLAPESIPPGERWEETLVAAVAEQCTHFLVILSESSVRSSWVLKEIDLIRRRCLRDETVKVLPLRMGSVSAFDGEQFLRTFQDIPYSEPFAALLRRVAEAVGLPPLLPAMFRNLIAETTRDFVGRERVFASMQQFFSSEKKGAFFLSGEPGQGKTTVLAEYVRRTGCPAHFNIATAGIDTTAQFFDSIQSQLSANYGMRGGAFLAGETPSVAVRLSELLDQASEARPKGEPLVIAIDALDEVQNVNTDSANVLNLPPVLPNGVFLLLSGRSGEYRLTLRDPQFAYDLAQDPAENRRDIEVYLRKRLAAPAFESWLASKKWTVDRGVSELSDRSENNFMYLHYVLQEIERGNLRDPKEQLPVGLRGYYSDHWRRMGMNDRSTRELKLDVLQILALVRGAVSARLIADLVHAPASDVRAVIDEWRGFLHATVEEGTTRYRLYHSSFQEFLASKEALQDKDPKRWLVMLADGFSEAAFS